MLKYILPKILAFSVLPIAIYSFQRFTLSPIGNTAVWWLIQTMVLFIFIAARFIYFEVENNRYFRIVDVFLVWIVFSLIRGIFMAENYWDYKSLVGRIFDLLILVVGYVASNKERLQSILSFFIKYALPFSLLLIIYQGVFMAKGMILFPLAFLLLFIPGLKLHWKLILIFLTLIVLVDGIVTGTRSFIFKFGMPVILLLLYYFRYFIAFDKIVKNAHAVFLIAPWILFALGVSGIFNVFKIDEYLKINYVAKVTTAEGIVKTQDITEDSRTFIYREVLQSAQKYNYWILGRSPARGNETVAFAGFFEEISGRNERYRNEANVPNIFTWMGIIGLSLYFLVFYKASALAVYRSNNIYSKLLGLFVASRWAYAWVEDYSSFGMNDFTIWLMVGACLSVSFRKMNNVEVKLWARGIFERRYVWYMEYLKKNFPKNYAQIKPVQF
jgi:hypothetical protein